MTEKIQKRSPRRVVWFILAAVLILLALGYFLIPFILDRAIAENSSFRFYGRVVDLAGQPIVGAVVRYDISAHATFSDHPLNPFISPPTNHVLGKVSTDANGDFDVPCDGFCITIESFAKPGYTSDGPNNSGNLIEPDLQYYFGTPGGMAAFKPTGRVAYVLQLKTW